MGARPGVCGRDGCSAHLAEDGLVDEVQFARQTVGCLGSEAVLLQDLVDDRQDFGEAFCHRLQSGALVGKGDLDSLDHVGSPRLLGFGLLGAEAHELKEVGETSEGGVGGGH